jgi:hypothetical protein
MIAGIHPIAWHEFAAVRGARSPGIFLGLTKFRDWKE